MERLSHIYDYAGNLIFLHQNVLDNQNNLIKISNEQYMDVVQIILAPSVVIELNLERIRYYYKTICKDKTLLIGVCFAHGLGEMRQLWENPSSLLMLKLAKKSLLEAYIEIENDKPGTQSS